MKLFCMRICIRQMYPGRFYVYDDRTYHFLNKEGLFIKRTIHYRSIREAIGVIKKYYIVKLILKNKSDISPKPEYIFKVKKCHSLVSQSKQLEK